MIRPDSEEKAVRRRCRGEDGVFTPWFLVLVVPMMMMAGLVFDGGHVLAERRDALDLAQNAARAGIQGIDSAQVRQGSPTIDPDRARAAVTGYLHAAGFAGTIEVTVTATEVSVVLTQDVEMQLLSAVGVDDKTVTGRATARIVRGVEGADT